MKARKHLGLQICCAGSLFGGMAVLTVGMYFAISQHASVFGTLFVGLMLIVAAFVLEALAEIATNSDVQTDCLRKLAAKP